jgi:hypothetical protein
MWRELFDDRQRKEIKLDQLYLAEYGHGTDGHNIRIIVAKFANLLDGLCESQLIAEEIRAFVVQTRIDNDDV